MLKNKDIYRIKVKMLKENINQSKLCRKLHCSNCALSNVLNKKKTLLKLESRLLQWVNNEEIIYNETKTERKEEK